MADHMGEILWVDNEELDQKGSDQIPQCGNSKAAQQDEC